MKIISKSLAVLLVMTSMAMGQLFINEIDYDQPSTDSAEFLEIAGPAGTYTNVTVELVNGNTTPGSVYQTVDIPSLTLADETDGYGFFVIGAATVSNVDLTPSGWPTTNIIQNGAPDGIVLKINGSIVNAVSYEGTMNDEDGNPMEIASATEDVYEGSEGESLSRLGLQGSPWQVASTTPGAANVDQVFEEVNYAPVAAAGEDVVVRVNDDVTLDGSESYDPDGSIASYAWTQLSGTSVTLNNANAAVATFTAPAAAAELSFRLEVTDDGGLTADDTVTVSVVDVSESTIIISEYVEGSSNNKYLEIANVGEETVDLNAEGFTMGMASNGSADFSVVLEDWGHLTELAPGNVIVLAAEDHTLYTTPDTVFSYPSVVHYNGNDAVALFHNGVIVDIVGNPNSDEYIIGEMTLRRKTSVAVGNPVFTMDEWIQLGTDDVSGLGMHGGADAPSFENAVRSPEFVTSVNAIEVSIDIVPAENAPAITAMDIEYGTGGSFLNAVGTSNTWNDHDNTWMGEIPAQAGDQKINYRFVALDADGNEHRSGAYYVLIASATPTPIADIHDNVETWEGQIKTIHGVMTIGSNVIQTDRTNAYIQDASGNGLNLYDPTLYPDLERGAEVTVVGEIDLYYTTIELKNFTYQITATGQPLPDPAELTVSQANDSEWEGTLIKVPGVVSNITSYSSNTAVTITDGNDSLEVVFWNSTGIDIAELNEDREAVFMGVGGQYASKYQLIVGYQEDFGVVNSVQGPQTQLPRTFELFQPYPNPFNARATIQWSLPEASDLTVDIVNLTGQVVETLHQGHLCAGSYSYIWNADAFASGIYVVRMRAADRVFHQKLVLLK
ncbi:MAG: PKD domain-containing protein [Fidelibacterota bacterium]